MIESLNSPHVARVKALIGSRGVKERKSTGQFVAEGMQCAREALVAQSGPQIETLYLTTNGRIKVEEIADLAQFNVVDVSDEVMKEMSETITPQGILAICTIPTTDLKSILLNGSRKFIYLSEVQDPGNAGTILRSADAFAMDAVITSPGSVDMYSPKVVRATAGSLWHVPLFTGITLAQLSEQLPMVKKIALSAQGSKSLLDVKDLSDVVAIFGNEARGIDALIGSDVMQVSIPMTGNAESLNLAAAAAIVIFHLSHN